MALERLWDPFVWQEVRGVVRLKKTFPPFFLSIYKFISDCKCFYISSYAAAASGKS